MASFAKKAINFINPVAKKEADGRDQFPNRLSFILAAIVSRAL